MKALLLLCLPLFVLAQSYGLKNFIESASKTNGLIEAKKLTIKSKEQEVEAARSAYWPTVDIGADYSFQSPNYIVSPGQTGNAFISANLNLYDGGRKDALLRSKGFEHKASLFEKTAFEKSITLEIARHYYGIQSLKATLSALQERSKELKAQIDRVKKFKLTGLATQEEVDKLQSVYEGNQYTIENTKLAIETSEENLKLISGLPARHLRRNYFLEPRNVHFEWFETIKILQANANAVGENAKAIDAGYMPQVNLSDTYHKSHFDDLVSMPGGGGDAFLIDHQNKVGVSVNMRLFDNGKMSKDSEAVKYKKLALLSQLDQAKKEQRMNFNLARQNLRTTKAKMKSSKSALKAATSTYNVLKQKFEVGLVDDIAFLDALATKTLAESRYKESVYDYEVKKSIYYYYAGKDPKEFIR
ncbi:TolC family protein [Sulfurovum sp. NBC37-1]|uniref:TolC family protein n=1 Tax=Sulfurovum sp. (strain NBC37-1) TaxID=387093 RepID=UPI0001587613|nr:TolC family protein [Sulfurovum sp. NBC37-1]BAF71233.1 outer membrane efflux protein [Sulfurovum sp. NBC37-1]